jgi:phosphoglycerate dehydrogenase-like enzyme
MSFRFVFLPPQTATTRAWAQRLAAGQPGLDIVVAEDEAQANTAIVDADAAYGRLHPQLLARARKLRWLQSPQIAPPAGYYYPELVAHPLVVTNMREIFNDHIGAHIMAYVLAFARGFHYYIPQQLKAVWQPRREDTGVIHLPEATR